MKHKTNDRNINQNMTEHIIKNATHNLAEDQVFDL
jgi:hypothetical protein